MRSLFTKNQFDNCTNGCWIAKTASKANQCRLGHSTEDALKIFSDLTNYGKLP